ncbi:MAG: hypothetical protein KIT84_11815 [Labilithrix sp.]|nr:hypothetical protein [Labilithrix sp.]MCW5811697.1 hypothetical protein [Labilithrix sp.]
MTKLARSLVSCSLLSLLGLMGCSKSRVRPTPAGSASVALESPPPHDPPARDPTFFERSARAGALIEHCSAPPPTECDVDADCAIFDIPTFDGGDCASTMRLGITAAGKDAYLRSKPCPGEREVRHADCVVHWVRAESDTADPPPNTEIRARCVKTALNYGLCRASHAY